VHMQIDAIEQRSAHARAIALHDCICATAAAAV
jgi:hypothetical protein